MTIEIYFLAIMMFINSITGIPIPDQMPEIIYTGNQQRVEFCKQDVTSCVNNGVIYAPILCRDEMGNPKIERYNSYNCDRIWIHDTAHWMYTEHTGELMTNPEYNEKLFKDLEYTWLFRIFGCKINPMQCRDV